MFTGDLEGDGWVEWLMCYAEDSAGPLRGDAADRGGGRRSQGQRGLETTGDFNGSEAVGTWTVLPGSATGELVGITGSGRFEAPHRPTATYVVDISFGAERALHRLDRAQAGLFHRRVFRRAG